MGIPALPKIFAIGTKYIQDIWQDPVEITEKVDGCFHYDTAITLADGTKETIGKIVNQRLALDVLSFDEKTQSIVINRITNWFVKAATNDWLKIHVEAHHGQPLRLWCTPTHRILTNNGWKQANKLKVGDSVLRYELACSAIQTQMLYGSILGDTSIHGKRISICHGAKQNEYLTLKKRILANLIKRSDSYMSGYGTKINRHTTTITPASLAIYSTCYPNGKKEVTETWINELTALSLAFWYMDDGSLNNTSFQKGHAVFHTNAFSYKENELLAAMLQKKFGMQATILKTRKYFYLSLNSASTEKLCSVIFPFVPASMRYKLYQKYKEYPCIWDNYNFEENNPQLIAKKVIGIEKAAPHNKKRYDIEVEKTHTYLVNNIVVHNSQFVFGRDSEGVLRMRSKGKEMFFEAPEKMFAKAADYVNSVADRIPDDTYFYCEYLKKPKHNTLAYAVIPKNHLVLFGISKGRDTFINQHNDLVEWAATLEIDVIPLLTQGIVAREILPYLHELLQQESYLGGQKIEGVVVKNYYRSLMIGDQIIPLTMGKFVSEAFKEKHGKDWKTRTGKGTWEMFCDSYRTEARWQKAVQHLRDNGELAEEPKDIGTLIKEVQRDITEEEKEEIKNFLWTCYGKDVLRTAIRGLPEWYKEKLVSENNLI